MDYYLKANTKEELLEDLRNVGFEWYDYDDEFGSNPAPRDPKKYEVITVSGLGSCIYLEHLIEQPAIIDEEGNITQEPVFTSTFHANARMNQETEFNTKIDPIPSSLQFAWL